MKRFLVLSAVTAAAILPAAPAFAAGDVQPTGYQPGCEAAYQAGKPGWDALFATPLKAGFGPMEKALCGEQKNVPA